MHVSVLATEVGTYMWHATYSGDANNNGASDNGVNEGVTTIKSSPAINTRAKVTPSNVVGVATLTDLATLTGGYLPGGTIRFTLTAPDGTTKSEGSVTVTDDGTSTSPTSVRDTGVDRVEVAAGDDTEAAKPPCERLCLLDRSHTG